MSYYYLSSGLKPKHVTLPINSTSKHHTDKNAPCNLCDIHNHINLEITTVLSGEVHVQLDNTDCLVKAGETILANPFVLHSYTREKDCDDLEYITLTITLSSIFSYPNSELSVCASDLVETRCRFDEFYPAGHPISEYVKNIHKLYRNKSLQNESLSLANVYGLLGELLEHHYHSALENNTYKRDVTFLQNVTAYIRENYAKDITSVDVAGELFMGMSHFCRVFRRHFGTSFSNHLCKYRIERAVELYTKQEMPLAEVAKQVGFNDYCYFSRSFKRYMGESPAQYLKKHKKS